MIETTGDCSVSAENKFTVRELIDILQQLNPEDEILIGSPPHPFSGWMTTCYEGEIVLR